MANTILMFSFFFYKNMFFRQSTIAKETKSFLKALFRIRRVKNFTLFVIAKEWTKYSFIYFAHPSTSAMSLVIGYHPSLENVFTGCKLRTFSNAPLSVFAISLTISRWSLVKELYCFSFRQYLHSTFFLLQRYSFAKTGRQW